MKRITLPALATLVNLLAIVAHAQIVNTATIDTTSFTFKGKVTVEGYVDIYYSYNFNDPNTKEQPYLVSMSRRKELSVNLAYIDVKYSSSRLRARFVPGFGSYMNSNYASERATFKNIVEASGGVKLAPNRNIWVDAGVFGSPYTNESAISKDHLAYTRSLAPEFVPYYLSGLKLTVPVSGKLNAYVYLVNGWQQIEDKNNQPSLGTQLEYRPTDHLLLNWDTYIGEEQAISQTTSGQRYFTDIYFIYAKGKYSATGCAYAGVHRSGALSSVWWQANLIGRFDLTKKLSTTARVEVFDDPDGVFVLPITGQPGFRMYSASLGLNFKVADNCVARLETRTFMSEREAFVRSGVTTKSSNSATANLTIWF